MTITDIAGAVASDAEHKIIGVRPGEKLHEQMIGPEDAPYTYAYADHYKILPMIHNWSNDPLRIRDGVKVEEGFAYTSNNNHEWMSVETLRQWVEAKRNQIGIM